MAGRLDEEQAAMNTSILDVTFTLSCKLLAKVCGVLILDILDDWVPASAMLARNYLADAREEGGIVEFIPAIVVDLVTVTRGVDNV